MEVSTVNGFNLWLNAKLREFNTDETVFGSYIMGILEGDESIDEKTEGLEGILAEIIESDCSTFIKEILDKWKQCHLAEDSSAPKQKLDVDEQLAKLLENQKLAKKEEREYTEEERRIKQQILSQYSQLSESEHEDDDDDDGAGGGGGAGSSNGGLARNTNAADVAALVREKREQAKLESQQKKDKDKQDREKQKQLREEKKEKRKTVKGERRR